MLDALLEKIFRYPKTSVLFVAILVAVGGTLLWWQIIWQNPHRVFEDMLVNNLEAPSVTKHASVHSSAQSVDQYIKVQMGATNAADWLVQATQGNAMVATENIGTPTAGYIRYTHISTGTAAGGLSPRLNGILNVWGKGDGKTDTSLGQLFSDSVLDISIAPLPPIGNLTSAQRGDILTFMRNNRVFNPSYGKVKRETVRGHHVYTYQVAVPLGAYVAMMQQFAHDLGLTNLDTVDPSQYASAAPVTLTLSVDRTSHELVQAAYAQSGFTQEYSGWGITSPIQLPAKTISTTELQQRIQALSTAR